MNAPFESPVIDAGRMPAIDPFAAERARLDRLLEREIVRLRARYELSLDEFRGLYISDEQVDALLRQHRPQLDPMTELPAPALLTGTRWAALADAFTLTRDDLDIVLLALGPELDPRYEILYAYLNNDVTRKLPTPELAQRVFGRDPAHRLALRGRLHSDGALCSNGVIEFAPGSRDVARMQRGLRVPSALADWLLGLRYDDERLSGIVRVVRPAGNDACPSGAEAVLARLADVEDPSAPVLVVTAATANDAARAAQRALGDSTRTVLALDLLALKAVPAPSECIGAVMLMQRVLRAPLVASPLDALVDLDGHSLDVPSVAVRRLAARTRPLLLASGASVRWRDVLAESRSVEVPLRELDTGERCAVWQDALGSAADAVGPQALMAVADRFVLGFDRIENAARHAFDLARVEGVECPDARHLYAAARAVSIDGGADVIRPVRQHFGWNDLIVPPEIRQRLRELVRAVETRPHVFDDWGFAHSAGGARGIRAMFAGSSGTGKTMAASIVARELGLDLHRVELSAIMSKYIGETEKNLERAFAAARRANAILFIDEADALLGKRSEVKDAHDRYANVEIAYLLQKMEDHDGVMIVATNLAQNIDAAFSRRMQFVIQFPQPDVPSRERLWRAMLPAAAPVSADLDLAFLARQFQFVGGDICNIALDAAFRAADAGTAIGMREILAAIIHHYAKLGRLPHTNEFGHFAALLQQGERLGAPRPSRVEPA